MLIVSELKISVSEFLTPVKMQATEKAIAKYAVSTVPSDVFFAEENTGKSFSKHTWRTSVSQRLIE